MSGGAVRKKTCLLCGREFETRKECQVYCSKECARKVAASKELSEEMRKRKAVARGKTAVCPFCGKPARPKAVYCERCKAECYDNVHKMFGRTNGWDKPQRKRVRVRKDYEAFHTAERYGQLYHFVGAAKNWGQA